MDEQRPRFFPQLGPYGVFDDEAYTWMSEDAPRTRRYEEAVRRRAPSRIVLDIGTGRDANWAVAAARAGAKRCWAIERDPGVAEQARETVRRAGVADRVTVVTGDSTRVELPERVDLVVSETIGDIGSSEGGWSLACDAWSRFLRPGGSMIPRRCVTRIAAVSLPEELHRQPVLGPRAQRYCDRIFERCGGPFDVRVSLAGASRQSLLSSAGVFEDLDFTRPAPLSSLGREVVLDVSGPGRLDGFLLWIELTCDDGLDALDSLAEDTSFHPAFFPAFHPGLRVLGDERIEATCWSSPSHDGVHPDYAMDGVLRSPRGVHSFAYRSLHRAPGFRVSPFHAQLFPPTP
jgi:type I protein arginine methyltransferase